jgi:UDP:flavonoid glycosyltransferase YjiC (YdhE family)
MLLRKHYKAARVADELSALLNNPAYAHRAAEVGRRVQSETGARAACDLIEEVLSNSAEIAAHGEELIHAAGD